MEDPEARLRRRMKERFGSNADAILQIVLDGVNYQKKEIEAFIEFDEVHTGAPQNLTNPGGYYRTLVIKFQLSQSGRREAARQDRQREIERKMERQQQPEEKPVCQLGICNGRREVYSPDGFVTAVCECEAGRKLPQSVRELIELMKSGAA